MLEGTKSFPLNSVFISMIKKKKINPFAKPFSKFIKKKNSKIKPDNKKHRNTALTFQKLHFLLHSSTFSPSKHKQI